MVPRIKKIKTETIRGFPNRGQRGSPPLRWIKPPPNWRCPAGAPPLRPVGFLSSPFLPSPLLSSLFLSFPFPFLPFHLLPSTFSLILVEFLVHFMIFWVPFWHRFFIVFLNDLKSRKVFVFQYFSMGFASQNLSLFDEFFIHFSFIFHSFFGFPPGEHF